MTTITLQDLYDGQQLLIRLVNGMGSQVTGLEHRMGNLAAELGELKTYTESGFEIMNERFDRLENRMDTVEGKVDNIENNLTAIR